MKKITLFLLLLVTIHISAQIKRVAEFDFTNPTGLNPSITPRTDNGGGLKVSDKVFTNGLVSISFVEGNQITGAKIMTGIDEEWGITSYCLRLTYTTQMIFSCTNGAEIDSIRVSHDSVMGDWFLLDETQPGKLDFSQGCEFWESESKSVNKVVFKNGPSSTDFKKIKVYYKEKTAVLNPSFDLTNGGVYDVFESLKMIFDRSVSSTGSNVFSVKDSNNNKIADLVASCSGKFVTLSLTKPVSAKGTYKIVIPAGCFVDAEGHTNVDLEFTFSIIPPKNTFNFISSEPTSGTKVDKLSDKFSITFHDDVGYVDTTPLVLYKDNMPKRAVVMSKDNKQVIFSFQNATDDLTEPGLYTIDVPEKAIYNAFKGIEDYECYNAAFQLSYEIGTTPDPKPDPEPDPKPEDSETMKLAKQLVVLSGIGYPTAESTSKKHLKEMTEAETVPSDEELNTAIEALYSENNVEMPTAGKWYTIANVDSKGTKRYLSVKDNAISISANLAEATAFEAGENCSFKTIDGKYLYTNGLRDAETSLELKKFSISSVEAEKTFGTVSIYGFFKTNAVGKEFDAYALVDCANGALATDETITDLQFEIDNNLSSAFALSETTKPLVEVPAVQTNIIVSPDVLPYYSDKLTVVLPDVDEVTLDETIMPYVATNTGVRKANASISKVEGKNNQFEISLAYLANGNYCLIIPEGIFLYTSEGKQVKNQQYSKAFTIGTNGSGDDGGFDYSLSTYFIYNSPGQGIPVKDTFLNEFIIYIENDMYSGLYADENKTVKLVKYTNADNVIRTGHFETCYIDVYNTSALKFVCNKPIEEGELKSGIYTFIIEPGTFGDANFKKYLSDKTSVKASACKVNPDTRVHFTVDNDKATGIKDITVDSAKKNVIYDLMGRRVQSMSRPGIYIVNGKKVVKK